MVFKYRHKQRSVENITRFSFVGVFGSTLNYSVFWVLHHGIQLNYQFSGVIGFLSPIPLVYFLNKTWSFKSTIRTNIGLPLYLAVNVVALLGHMKAQYIAHEVFSVSVNSSQIIGIFVSATINFLLAKFIVFRV